jgi:hypothetical protein
MATVTHSADDLMIATTNSGLVETTVGDDDECKPVPAGPPKPFNNFAKFSETGDKSSERTLFADGNVIRVDDAVGPPKGAPTHPAHPPHILRMDGGPYQQEARATEGAPNVTVENKLPARFMDPTTQNAANAEGIVFDLGRANELQKMAADRLKRCSLTEDKVTCSHGRELGKVGEVRVLEIVSDPQSPCTLLFEATRQNAVEPGPPSCKHSDGRHTEWTVHRVPGGFLPERKETRHGDVLHLDESWTSTAPIPVVQAKTKEKTKEPKDELMDRREREQEAQRRANERFQENPNRQGGRGKYVGQARKEVSREHEEAAAKAKEAKEKFEAEKAKHKTAANKARNIANLLNLAQFLRVCFWDRWPVRIDVASQACTGGLQSQILVFPAEEVDFKLSDKDIPALKVSVKAITTFGEWLAGALKRLMKGFTIEVKVLEDPELELKCVWEELTQDAPLWGKKKHQCARKMSLRIKMKKIVGIKIEVPVPWARIIDVFAPMAGTGIETIINLFGVEVVAGLGLTFDLGVEGGASVKSTGEAEAAVSILFDFKFYLFLRIVFRKNLNVEVQALARWNPKITGKPSYEDFIKLTLEEGDARLGLTGYVTVSTFWWERSYGGEVWPEFLRYKYGETDMHPVKMLMSMAGKS